MVALTNLAHQEVPEAVAEVAEAPKAVAEVARAPETEVLAPKTPDESLTKPPPAVERSPDTTTLRKGAVENASRQKASQVRDCTCMTRSAFNVWLLALTNALHHAEFCVERFKLPVLAQCLAPFNTNSSSPHPFISMYMQTAAQSADQPKSSAAFEAATKKLSSGESSADLFAKTRAAEQQKFEEEANRIADKVAGKEPQVMYLSSSQEGKQAISSKLLLPVFFTAYLPEACYRLAAKVASCLATHETL